MGQKTETAGLAPSRLLMLWKEVEAGRMTRAEFMAEDERQRVRYRDIWSKALLLSGERDLTRSILLELAARDGTDDLAAVRRRCEDALAVLKTDWQSTVSSQQADQVTRYYDRTVALIYELMWWHALDGDSAPLAYVAALDFAQAQGCKNFLDFGSGVGSGGILFARNGVNVTLADISSTMLDFCRWRLGRREIVASYIDLKTTALSAQSFDFVAAMDVFEHLSDPLAAVDAITASLKPGGYLYGRFAGDEDPDRPQHIVHDFTPVFARMAERGLVEVWKDRWFWGHQVFCKTA
ncbi:MAG: class I SAM-dependent methyltransferase [Alphaproteobacteria bacterium]|nr:class I SAM-dependent methyltransferase [Alphaproteobacteria bacterium]